MKTGRALRLEQTEPRSIRNGEIVFADESARALLGGRLDELTRPAESGWVRTKQSASRTVYENQIEGQQIYLKHYHRNWPSRRLRGALGASDAMTEMRFSRYLAENGIQTARVLAAACTKEAEWLATEAVRPAESADEWHARNLQRGADGRKAIRKAIINLARVIAKMHSIGVLHCDLHAGNIMIRTDAPDPQCVLMDLHRMRKRPWISRRSRAANLAQLLHDRSEWSSRS